MEANGTVTLQESVNAPRDVAWLRIGGIYQIRTQREIFAMAKVLRRKNGNVELEYYGTPPGRYMRRPNTPLCKSLRPVRQTTCLPIAKILKAQEVVQ